MGVFFVLRACLTGEDLMVCCFTGDFLMGELCLRGDSVTVVTAFLGDLLTIALFLGDLILGVAGVQDWGEGRFTSEAVVTCVLPGLLAAGASFLAARGAGTG